MNTSVRLAFLFVWIMVMIMALTVEVVEAKGAPRGKTEVFSNRSLCDQADVTGLRFDPRLVGFRLQDDPAGGYFESGTVTSGIVYYDFGVNSIVPSWNADCPDGSYVRVELQVRIGGDSDWSAWYQIANWGDPKVAESYPQETALKENTFGKVVEDTLELKQPCSQVRFRVTLLTTDKAVTPVLTLVSVAGVNKGLLNAPDDSPGPAWGRSVKCDYVSQLVQSKDLYWRVCGPTSLTMALTAHGIRLKVPVVAKRAWDALNNIYGNWSFLASAGSDLMRRYTDSIPQRKGYRKAYQSFVMWPSDWKAIEREVLSGNPCILSIRFNEGELTAAKFRLSDGHLILVRGFTKTGDVICCDPNAKTEKEGRVVYDRHELHNARHGGPIIVVHPYAKQ